LGELRWILSGLGILALGAIWWWTARRSAQTPGKPELRESTAAPLQAFGPAAAESASTEKRSHMSGIRDWGVPPLEPLDIRSADFEPVPLLDDEPMLTQADPLDLTIDIETADRQTRPEVAPPQERPSAQEPPSAQELKSAQEPAATQVSPSARGQPPRATPAPNAENSDHLGAAAPLGPNASEAQKIVTVRVCCVGDSRWSGAALMAALEVHGLAYGRYQVYHRKHSDGRSIFCVASLVEPGTFDLQRMAEEEYRGVTLFAVLPGPLEPLRTVDALMAAARDLARELSGTVQDVKGVPFSPQRVATLREEVARFQAQLP
jgi:cell division protein ZipA